MISKIVMATAITTILTLGSSGTSHSVTLDQIPAKELQTFEQPKKSVEEIVDLYATKYGVSAKKMMETIRCENRDLDPKLQSGIRYKQDNPKWKVKKGEREKSFGLVQIHLPDHPEISYEQATDPEFSIEFMAKKFSEGHGYEWSCY